MTAATFSRASVAHKLDGSQVAANAPRYETGLSGQAIMVEEGTTNLCLRNIGAQSLGASVWGSDGPGTLRTITSGPSFHGDRYLRWTYGGSRATNLYLTPAGEYTATLATAFTVSAKVRRSDGGPVSGLGGYLYVSNNADASGPCVVTPLRDGWYLATYTRSGLAAGAVTLTGFYGMDPAVSWDFDGWQVEAKAYATSFVFGTRADEVLTVPFETLLTNLAGDWTLEVNFSANRQGNFRFVDAWPYLYLGYGNTDIPRASWYENGVQKYLLAAAATSNPEAFHCFALRRKGTGLALFVDGVNVAETASTSLTGTPPATFRLGGWPTYPTNGLVDRVRGYDRALSDTEILNLYAWRGL